MTAADTPAPAPTATAEQFAQPEQQRESALLGMWTFLATEMLLFGGLFFAILVYRILYPAGVREASQHLYKSIGGINTAVLLTSSLMVALAALAAQEGQRRAVVRNLVIAASLGATFLAIKGAEYFLDYREGLVPGLGGPFPLGTDGARLFINAYFFATGLHALHVLIGVVLLAVIAGRAATGLALPGRSIVVEVTGLYWHFVDVVWIFLYPALYLVGS